MKIIAFGDIHMATEKAATIPGIKDVDLILLNGDLTNYGGAKEAKTVLDEILKLNRNVLAHFGNLDNKEVDTYLDDLGINLHGQARLVQGKVCIVGIGGSNPTPFNTPSEFSEKQLLNLGHKAFAEGQEYTKLAHPIKNRTIPFIFLSHTPPLNTKVDVIFNGAHVGSSAIRSIIEQYQPPLCICGHIHEAKGVDTINETAIYNPGMLDRSGWVSVTIDQNQLEVSLK